MRKLICTDKDKKLLRVIKLIRHFDVPCGKVTIKVQIFMQQFVIMFMLGMVQHHSPRGNLKAVH